MFDSVHVFSVTDCFISCPHAHDLFLVQVRPCLTELMQSDPDDDVKFFSAQALESIR